MFITFEGIDGSGKSTQAALLAKSLEELGYPVLLTREPGGTRAAEGIRELLLHSGEDLAPMTEVFLFCAARNEHLEKIILPALEKGIIVISDRYYDSTTAYQGGGRELGLQAMMEASRSFRIPDRTYFIDTSLPAIAKRLAGMEKDRMEQEGEPFMKRVREAYLILAQGDPERFRTLEGDRKEKEIAREILAMTLELLS